LFFFATEIIALLNQPLISFYPSFLSACYFPLLYSCKRWQTVSCPIVTTLSCLYGSELNKNNTISLFFIKDNGFMGVLPFLYHHKKINKINRL